MSEDQKNPFLDRVGLQEEFEKERDFPVEENAATRVLSLLLYPRVEPRVAESRG